MRHRFSFAFFTFFFYWVRPASVNFRPIWFLVSHREFSASFEAILSSINTLHQRASYSTRAPLCQAEDVYYYLMLIKIWSVHQFSQFLVQEFHFLSKLGFKDPLILMSKARCFLWDSSLIYVLYQSISAIVIPFKWSAI